MNPDDVSDVVKNLLTENDVGYRMTKVEEVCTVIAMILNDFPIAQLFDHNAAPVFDNQNRANVI